MESWNVEYMVVSALWLSSDRVDSLKLLHVCASKTRNLGRNKISSNNKQSGLQGLLTHDDMCDAETPAICSQILVDRSVSPATVCRAILLRLQLGMTGLRGRSYILVGEKSSLCKQNDMYKMRVRVVVVVLYRCRRKRYGRRDCEAKAFLIQHFTLYLNGGTTSMATYRTSKKSHCQAPFIKSQT